MSDLAGVLIQQRDRVSEIAGVFARYGFAELASRAVGSESLPGGPLRFRPPVGHVSRGIAGMMPGERLRAALTELGTTWIKLGQMLSVRPDIVGDDIARELTGLQVAVPADPPPHAERLIERELGRPASELFASFEPVAMASGSVAQIHRATLPDGSPVAVKILHDGVERRLISDLELMRALASFIESVDDELARYRPTRLVEEFESTMRSAMDLRKEQRNLLRFAENFKDEPDVVIPIAYRHLSTRAVLTMEMMHGERLSRDTATGLGWNVEELVERASRIYLDMIFRDGAYHADPHPGNFLLRRDKDIVILDFGDIGYVSAKRREQIASMLMAMKTRDLAGLTSLFATITDAPADTDLDALSDDLDHWMDEFLAGDLSGLDIVGMLSSAMHLMHRHALALPADLATLVRVLLLLQGMAAGLGSSSALNTLIEPYVTELIRQRMSPGSVAKRFAQELHGWAGLLESGPHELRAFLTAARDGTLGVDVRVRDPAGRIDYLVDGLIVSALVVVSGQLTSRRAAPLVRSVSVPGALAAGLGAFAYRRMRDRRASRRLRRAGASNGAG